MEKQRKVLFKAVVAILLTVSLIIPVISAEPEPPEITNLYYDNILIGVPTYFYIYCYVTDDTWVMDVKINITGPNGYSHNVSMIYEMSYYYYYDSAVMSPGNYEFVIYAVDVFGNSMTSEKHYITVLEDYLDIVYVDDSNTQGPYNGSIDHPFIKIKHGLIAVNNSGTIHVNNGHYPETGININKKVNIIGESKENVLIDGLYINDDLITIQVDNTSISNCTIHNTSLTGISLYSCNNTIENCIIHNCHNIGIAIEQNKINNAIQNCDIHNQRNGIGCSTTSGNYIIDCNIYNMSEKGIIITYGSNNYIYYNNFYNNPIHVQAGSNANTWDDGTYGNYWDNYQSLYPDATINPTTGTWNTPYQLNTQNIDNHPWVFPDGEMDEQDPIVTVIYPNGGESLSDEITIEWAAIDDLARTLNGTILIEYSDDAGSNWEEIASELDNTGSYLWNTSSVADGEDYLIRVSATDEFDNTGYDTSDNTFIIENYETLVANANGPYEGTVDELISFTGSATGGLEPYSYYWDFGNGDFSEEQNPEYAYDEAGIYDVILTVTDSQGLKEDAIDETIATIESPGELEIGEITGGLLKVNVEIKNIDDNEATGVDWSIFVTGGILHKINVSATDIMETLDPNNSEIVTATPVFGLGKIDITVIASAEGIDPIEKKATGLVIGPFILGISES